MKETFNMTGNGPDEEENKQDEWVPSAVQTDPESVEVKAPAPETKEFNAGP